MNIVSFQESIATTGTAQQLPSNPVVRSVTINAPSTNTGTIALSAVPTVITATGFILEKGNSVTIELPGGNTDSLFAVGTSGDVFSVIGA